MRRPTARACRRSWPRWRRRGLRSIVPRPGAWSPAANRHCASMRSQRCWPRTRWWSTPAACGWAWAPRGGRLRALVKTLAHIEATARGFVLRPLGACAVVVLAPPIDGDQASLVALLSDGAAWSTSALALALGASQRTVQRALAELEAAGRVRSIGRARARRWLAPPLAGFTTILLLPAALPID